MTVAIIADITDSDYNSRHYQWLKYNCRGIDFPFPFLSLPLSFLSSYPFPLCSTT